MIEVRDADPKDWGALKTFVCTDPPERDLDGVGRADPSHMAELEAQAGVNLELAFPLPWNERCIVAVDDGGVAGVAWWIRTGGQSVKLLVVASRRDARGKRIGDLLMSAFEQRLRSQLAAMTGVACIMATGFVRAANGSSRKMLARHGYFHLDDEGSYQRWMKKIDAPSA